MDQEEAFLRAFVEPPDETWEVWSHRFADLCTGVGVWSIDSLQQLLMKRITAAAKEGLVQFVDGACLGQNRWKVHDGKGSALLGMLPNEHAITEHYQSYAVKYVRDEEGDE